MSDYKYIKSVMPAEPGWKVYQFWLMPDEESGTPYGHSVSHVVGWVSRIERRVNDPQETSEVVVDEHVSVEPLIWECSKSDPARYGTVYGGGGVMLSALEEDSDWTVFVVVAPGDPSPLDDPERMEAIVNELKRRDK